jgi:hypothetical protein
MAFDNLRLAGIESLSWSVLAAMNRDFGVTWRPPSEALKAGEY